MSGLILKLAAGERVVVNGAVLENGDKPASLRVADADARVLRCRDALRPEDVDTPVKQVYYAIQLLITGDLKADNVLPAIFKEIDRLEDAFSSIDTTLMGQLREMMRRGNHYSALCHLKHILELEKELLNHAALRQRMPEQAKVA
ncbi:MULTISPECIES: flagellar biosynthesis repressor FlbT [Henriciella]|jgi:flagellar protein FlbT|uniref:Flagellar biosynthesis repressor FlbT n=1 Tax=Henriciella pelagia TaxID=1977912 RepID=A0ABQ1JVH7_9PROT|nr:flagellar biosynthesis repressor FlbT [Henriciella pelagia]GGB75891.1 flagellar biosynthesis repressor FlbT [Henriciella pelagia]